MHKNPLLDDPRRVEILRHIMQARKLAREMDEEMLDFLLEQTMAEAMGHDADAMSAALERLGEDELEP